jgi:hypothetical protein
MLLLNVPFFMDSNNVRTDSVSIRSFAEGVIDSRGLEHAERRQSVAKISVVRVLEFIRAPCGRAWGKLRSSDPS